MLKVIPLGGLGEIGLNMMALEHDGYILVIDAGLMFPEEYMPGVDMVIPDFYYLKENREKVRALILTHGHEDHIGALPYLLKELQIPVYGTPLTLGFARGRLAEHGVLKDAELVGIKPRDTLDFGGLHIEILSM